jgi:hypothetical protein
MFGSHFAERTTLRLERAVALGVLIGSVAALTMLSAMSPRRHHSCHTAAPRVVEALTHEQAYSRQEFTVAASLAHAQDPALADMYRRLDRAWRVGFGARVPASDAFLALREAWKLDTALGGAHSDTLQRRIGDIALIAGPEFQRAGDQAGADLAAHTVDVLGR